MTSGGFASFARQFVVVLNDSRLWIVVLPFLLIVSLILLFAGPRLATVLTLALGLIASYIINRIDQFPVVDARSSLNSLSEKILVPALAGILLIPSPEVLVRTWLMPWYWFHKSSEIPSCSFLITGSAWAWLGFLICGGLLAVLTRERSTFAAIIGVSVYIPLSFTDIFTGNFGQKALSAVASSCKFTDADSGNVDSFRMGMATALVMQALLAIFAARLVSSWLINRKKA
jgi:hypothetical protein